MGLYLAPGNENFKSILSGIYVDKTGLINVINNTINTPDKLTFVSRPRRFGKSYTAKMLSAYYDKFCDSRDLFADKKVEQLDPALKYLNEFNVVYLDITGFISSSKEIHEVVDNIRKAVAAELDAAFPRINASTLGEKLVNIVESGEDKFFFIIDEWDALFREYKTEIKLQEDYIKLLRELFKNGNVTDRVIAGAFMTGILPIKKYGHQSAISDFREYTMIQPSILAEYVGFTKKDIDDLCDKYQVNKTKLKIWYDGYSFPKIGEIYNPNSVSQAVRTGIFDSYWSKTETYEALREYINFDKNGLQADLIQMIGGNEMPVDTATFQNDMTSIQNRDDVLSLLIHLGYLAYDVKTGKARIPNEEIKREFISTIRGGNHDATTKIIKDSDQLIVDTIEGNEEDVADAIQNVHDVGTFGVSPLFYNDEQALRSVVKFAYISCANNYIKVEELPSGHGYAYLVYIPMPNSHMPVLLIELKMNDSVQGAISQIHEKRYPKVFENMKGDIVICAVTYDSKTKMHKCKIEKMAIDSIK